MPDLSESVLDHVNNLKNALLKLRATGENGFEGLIGQVLHEITDIPFRLANSGYQRGVDGKAAFEGAVAFEAKLYKNGSLPRADVVSKIPDLARHRDHADLVWVLGATCTVPSQLKDDLIADGTNHGISVLILDWIPDDFPRLAVVLAMSSSRAPSFLKANIEPSSDLDKALEALEIIRADGQFEKYEIDIHRSLDATGMATAMAKRANLAWFEKTVSDKRLASCNLGQPLAPRDSSITVLCRNGLVNTLGTFISDNINESVLCVHGEEGCGKSWIVIQSWLAQSDRPLLVFVAPDAFTEIMTQSDIETLLIEKLVVQTGGRKDDKTIHLWQRRLDAWENSNNPLRPNIVFFIDGINQRPDQNWGRIISNVSTYIKWRGGRVIFTTRTHYYKTRVKKALVDKTMEITVSKWSSAERDQILKQHDIPLNTLSSSVAEFLKNPRILSIALDVFSKGSASFEEFSIDQLLFEHINAGSRQNYGNDQVEVLERLRNDARELMNRVKNKITDDLCIFSTDLASVIDGRFFEPVKGEPRKYELSNNGLILALGLAIIENLRRAERNKRNLDDAFKEVVEPIQALDRTGEALMAAITVSAIDEDEYSEEVSCTLIKGFSDLQNPPSYAFATLISFAKARPQAFVESVRDLILKHETCSGQVKLATGL